MNFRDQVTIQVLSVSICILFITVSILEHLDIFLE